MDTHRSKGYLRNFHESVSMYSHGKFSHRKELNFLGYKGYYDPVLSHPFLFLYCYSTVHAQESELFSEDVSSLLLRSKFATAWL